MSDKSFVSFSQILELSIKRVFNEETAYKLENEYFKIWNTFGSGNFDFETVKDKLQPSNLNKSFIESNHFEIIKIEVISPKIIEPSKLNFKDFLTLPIDYKFYTKNYKIINSTDNELKINNTTLKIEQTLLYDFLHNAKLLPHFS
jgi:hypothetical protein